MSPYRASGPLPRAMRDPARARLGLAAGCVGALACFASLTHGYFATFTATDGTVLSVGAAVLAVAIFYSSLDAPAGRALLVLSAVMFATTFLLRPMGGVDARVFMRTWVWPVRYFAVAGAATGLLLRLRRSRPGASGALLRLAAIMGAWWGLQWMVTWVWSGADRSLRAEALSRACYLFLALGMLDVRRYLGMVPLEHPVRSEEDAAREMATTRACLAGLSVAVAFVAASRPWASQWAVIATSETVGAAVLLTMHATWLFRARFATAAVLAVLGSSLGVPLAVVAFGTPAQSVASLLCFALGAFALDASIAYFTRPSRPVSLPMVKPAFLLASAAIVLRVVALVLELPRLAP